MRTQNGHRGFTLLELVVVMTLLSIMTMAVMPIFSGTMGEISKEASIRNILSTLEYAQARAVTRGVEYRFYFETDNNEYWLMTYWGLEDGERVYEMIDEREGEPKRLSDGLTFGRPKNTEKDRDEDAYYIPFFPSGACGRSTIVIELEERRFGGIEISTKGSLSHFDVEGLEELRDLDL